MALARNIHEDRINALDNDQLKQVGVCARLDFLGGGRCGAGANSLKAEEEQISLLGVETEIQESCCDSAEGHVVQHGGQEHS